MGIDLKNSDAQKRKNLHTSAARSSARAYQDRNKMKRNHKETFGSQEVDLRKFIIAPEGYENIMFMGYFIAIPYIAGVLFLYLFVAGGHVENFMVLEISKFFIVWAIGYEVVAASLLLIIFYSFLNFKGKNRNQKPRKY
ncbi:MAG TPA: hypothetical protein ENK65_00765 [Helicobacteraceae bacterium]|nr:hypothetical protein [Helicobacteraceae bacterium]